MPGDGRPEVLLQDGVTVVVFGRDFERITEDRIPAATQTLLDSIPSQQPRLVVDLSQTTFFGSSFIEVLFRAWNRIHTKPGGRFALCGLSPYCTEVLQITNLDQLWKLYPTRDTAVQALQQPA
jgi:anti-anti-sigma factor